MKIKYLEYKCKKCKYEHIANWKILLMHNVKMLGISFLLMYFFLSMLLTTIPIYKFQEYGSNFRSQIFAYKLTYDSKEKNLELRDVALSMITSCTENDNDCIKYKIFFALTDMKYVLTDQVLNPIEIYKSGHGDCKNLAFLYSSLLSQVGEQSKVVCSNCHCWNEIEMLGDAYVVDLTIDMMMEKSYYNPKCDI